MVSRMKPFGESVSLFMHNVGTIIFIPALVCIITLDVILTFCFNSPLLWSKDVNGLILLVVFFASMTYCWDKKRHIRMEIIYKHFKGRLKAAADIATALAGIIFFMALGLRCLMEIPYMIRTNASKDFFAFPLWPFNLFIAFCSLIFLVKMLSLLLHQFVALIGITKKWN